MPRCTPSVEPQSAKFFCTQPCQRFCQSSEPCSNSLVYLYCSNDGSEESWGVGGGGGGSEFNMYFFTAGPTQIHTSQPFSLHCNKKLIHVAGDHHGSRQNIRLVRTLTKIFLPTLLKSFSARRKPQICSRLLDLEVDAKNFNFAPPHRYQIVPHGRIPKKSTLREKEN